MNENELMYEFLKRISGNGSMVIEYCRDCNSLKKKYKYNEIIKKYYDLKNLYFSSGIKDITKNRSRSNIDKINRITIDIDFRKQYREVTGKEVTDDNIILAGKELGKYLKENYPEDYGQWNFIVFSGNGIHIHYIGNIYNVKSLIDADLFREACIDFYLNFNLIVNNPIYNADMKVGDLGHLFRLPGTINEKESIKRECKIIDYQDIDSDVVNNLPLLLQLASNRIKIRQEELLKKMKAKEIVSKKYNTGVNAFEFINNNVNIADVIQILIPERKLKPDGKNFYNPAKGANVNASYFVDIRNNILIRNGSTKLPGVKEGFNPVSLVMEWFGFGGRECIQWFKSNGLISGDI